MPLPNGTLWRHRRAKMQLTSDQAATLLGIAGGSLRQIETNTKPVSLALAYRAEELYKTPVDELIDAAEKPGKPGKAKPKTEPTAPPGRRDGKDDRRGPRRVQNGAVA
jgi:transcriptional regulator with XRE-family HTH domain